MHTNNRKPNTGNMIMSVQNKATIWAQVFDNYAPIMYELRENCCRFRVKKEVLNNPRAEFNYLRGQLK